MDREVFLKFISEQKRISTKMLLFLHDPQKYSIATHICAALCLFVNLFYFPEYSIYLALDALGLCWWHLGEGKNLATLIMEQGSVALKKKKTPHLGEWGYKGDCYSAHGWKFKLIDINHIFLRFLFFFCFIPLKTNWDANHSCIILFMIFCRVLYMVSFLSYVQYLALNVKSMLKVTY